MSFPVQVLLGISFGLLIGTVPALVVGTLGFGVRYVADGELSGRAAVVVAFPVAAVTGVALGAIEPDPATLAGQGPRLAVTTLVVGLLALYASSRGDALAAELPRGTSRPIRRGRTLSAEAIDAIDGSGRVAIRATGEIRDVEGYPPLSPDLRERLRSGRWRLPADLPLSALEARLEDRLRTDHGLADASVSIDPRGRATIAAAPPSGGISRDVPDGSRAVSIEGTVPSGLAPGDEVSIDTSEAAVSGTVLGVVAAGDDGSTDRPEADALATDAGDGRFVETVRRTGDATAGGEGRVTVAVPGPDARPLLESDRARVVARSGSTTREFEALSVLERAGVTVRKVAPTRGDVPAVPDGVRPVAVRRGDAAADGHRREWTFDPDDRRLGAGDEAFLVGDPATLERFVEGVN